MKVSPVTLLSLFLLSAVPAQTDLWYLTRGYEGNDEAWAVAVDSSGKVYWATTESLPQAAHNDILLYIIDSTGQQRWQSRPLGDSVNRVAFIAVIREPYLYIGGMTERSRGDLLLLALRRDQDTFVLQWQYVWDRAGLYEEVDGIGATADAIYLSGWATPGPMPWYNDIVVQKLDTSGNLIWSNTWGTPSGTEGANGHLALDDSSIYVVSHYGPFNDSGDAVLVAFARDSGNFRWYSRWDSIHQNDNFYGLAMSRDSFLYCLGPFDSDSTIIPQNDLVLVKYTRTGKKVWERGWGGPRSEWGRAIVADGDSIVYVCANTVSYGAGATDIVLLKYDSSGTLLSYRVWGGAQDDYVHDIAKFGDYIYITGTTRNFGAAGEDGLLVKVNAREMQFPDTLVGITEKNRFPARNFRISPNPFTDQTVIELPARSQPVGIKIYDFAGRRVRTIAIPKTGSEMVRVTWNGTADSGAPLCPGIYFIQVQAGASFGSRKVLLLPRSGKVTHRQ